MTIAVLKTRQKALAMPDKNRTPSQAGRETVMLAAAVVARLSSMAAYSQ